MSIVFNVITVLFQFYGWFGEWFYSMKGTQYRNKTSKRQTEKKKRCRNNKNDDDEKKKKITYLQQLYLYIQLDVLFWSHFSRSLSLTLCHRQTISYSNICFICLLCRTVNVAVIAAAALSTVHW